MCFAARWRRTEAATCGRSGASGDGDAWHLWARRGTASGWSAAEKIGGAGSDTFHRAAAGQDGTVAVAWQSFRGGQSDIYLRARGKDGWSPEVKVSESPANDWEPSVAAGPDGTAYVAWDTYDRGNYDVCFRSWRGGTLSPLAQHHRQPALSGAHGGRGGWAGPAVGGMGRIGRELGQGPGLPDPDAVRHAAASGAIDRPGDVGWRGWQTPRERFPAECARTPSIRRSRSMAQGTLTMLFRHWTRHNDRTIGSPIDWEDYLTRFDGEKWTAPQPLAHSAGIHREVSGDGARRATARFERRG